MPAVAEGVGIAYLDPAAVWASQVGAVPAAPTGPRLEAAAVARVILRYQLAKAGLAEDVEYEAVVMPLPAQTVQLDPLAVDYDDRDLGAAAPANARYVLPEAKIGQKTYWSQLQKDLTDHLVANESKEILANPDLKLYSRSGETPEDFATRCQSAAMAEADKKAVPLQKKYETKLRTLQTRLATASTQAAQAKQTGFMDSAASVLGGFLGGRKSVSSITAAARKMQTAQNRAATAQGKVDDLQLQVQNLETELTDELTDLRAEWEGKAATIETVAVELKRTQVRITDLRLVWVPVG
jgi:hypothetical protein